MNTPEGLDLRVPTPTGDLTLPLDNGLKTKATWFTADASFDLTRRLAPAEHRPGHAKQSGVERDRARRTR